MGDECGLAAYQSRGPSRTWYFTFTVTFYVLWLATRAARRRRPTPIACRDLRGRSGRSARILWEQAYDDVVTRGTAQLAGGQAGITRASRGKW